MNELVSVIVPVYKKQDTLERCLESILAQDYDNLEIILVDDGSPDRCGEICDAYAKIDHRVMVIHQENQGVSAARNCGMDLSTGEYITFIDADDIIFSNFVRVNMSLFRNDVDIVVGAARNTQNNFIKVFGIEEACAAMFDDDNFGVHVWGKIYRKELIQDLRFPEDIKMGEDLQFFFDAIINSHSIIYSSRNLYQQNQSQYNSATTANVYQYMKAVEICLLCRKKAECLSMKECIKPIEKAALVRTIFVWNLISVSKEQHEELYKKCTKIIKEYTGAVRFLKFKHRIAITAILYIPKIYQWIVRACWNRIIKSNRLEENRKI